MLLDNILKFVRFLVPKGEIREPDIRDDMENGFISKLSDLKKIIKDAEKLGLNDETKIVIRDSDSNDYFIKVLKYNQKTKKIYLDVE